MKDYETSRDEISARLTFRIQLRAIQIHCCDKSSHESEMRTKLKLYVG